MGSGWASLQIPVSSFFLKLAGDSIKDVNRELDSINMSYARRAICSEMALALGGTWNVH